LGLLSSDFVHVFAKKVEDSTVPNRQVLVRRYHLYRCRGSIRSSSPGGPSWNWASARCRVGGCYEIRCMARLLGVEALNEASAKVWTSPDHEQRTSHMIGNKSRRWFNLKPPIDAGVLSSPMTVADGWPRQSTSSSVCGDP